MHVPRRHDRCSPEQLMRSLFACGRPRPRACLPAWVALLVLSAMAGATVVTGPPQPYCDIENSYGASMAVLGGRHLVVGSAGGVCDFVGALDPGPGEDGVALDC